MQVHLDLVRSRYPGMSVDERRALYLAVARAQSKLKDLRQQVIALGKAEKRVFAAQDVGGHVKAAYERKAASEWVQVWHLVVEWPSDDQGHYLVRRWKGDPRNGGEPERLPKSINVRGVTYEFYDLELVHEIEDVLVIDKNGKAEGGEVTEILKTLLPAVAKRAAP